MRLEAAPLQEGMLMLRFQVTTVVFAYSRDDWWYFMHEDTLIINLRFGDTPDDFLALLALNIDEQSTEND